MNYSRIGLYEVLLICTVSTFTLILTVLTLQHGVMEMNPIARWSFVNIGYAGTAFLDILVIIGMYLFLQGVGKFLGMPWLGVLAFSILSTVIVFDAYHDISVVMYMGGW